MGEDLMWMTGFVNLMGGLYGLFMFVRGWRERSWKWGVVDALVWFVVFRSVLVVWLFGLSLWQRLMCVAGPLTLLIGYYCLRWGKCLGLRWVSALFSVGYLLVVLGMGFTSRLSPEAVIMYGVSVLLVYFMLGDDLGRFLVGLVFIMGFMSDVREFTIIGYIDWSIHWPATYLLMPKFFLWVIALGIMIWFSERRVWGDVVIPSLLVAVVNIYPVFRWLCVSQVCRPCPYLAIPLFPDGFLLNLALRLAPLPLAYVFLEWFKKG